MFGEKIESGKWNNSIISIFEFVKSKEHKINQ